MKKSKLKNLALDKKQITKLTNLNTIWGGTGTLVDANTNPYDDTTTTPIPIPITTSPTSDPTITNPIGGDDPIGGTERTKKTTSRLCAN